MITKLAIAFGLMSLCVAIHALGLAAAFRSLRHWLSWAQTFWRSTGLLIVVAAATILMHMIEITVWAVFYTWIRAMPDLDTSLYFSAVTYTTVGYGDLLLPKQWRLVGGVEALTGIFMCGWSAAFFFAVANRIYRVNSNQQHLE
jgi:hypothetical protein